REGAACRTGAGAAGGEGRGGPLRAGPQRGGARSVPRPGSLARAYAAARPDAGAEGGGSGQPGGALPARARARPVRRGAAGRAGTGGGGRRGRARRGGAFLRSLRLGTRGSRLAMTQSGWVAERLREAVPGLSVELVEIRTSGDVIKDVPLGPALGQS